MKEIIDAAAAAAVIFIITVVIIIVVIITIVISLLMLLLQQKALVSKLNCLKNESFPEYLWNMKNNKFWVLRKLI